MSLVDTPPLPCELLAMDSCLPHRRAILAVHISHIHLKGIVKLLSLSWFLLLWYPI